MASKEEILDYVMNTPRNTNRAVLRGMLDSLGSGDNPAKDFVIYDIDFEWDTQNNTAVYSLANNVTFMDIVDALRIGKSCFIRDPIGQQGDWVSLSLTYPVVRCDYGYSGSPVILFANQWIEDFGQVAYIHGAGWEVLEDGTLQKYEINKELQGGNS